MDIRYSASYILLEFSYLKDAMLVLGQWFKILANTSTYRLICTGISRRYRTNILTRIGLGSGRQNIPKISENISLLL